MCHSDFSAHLLPTGITDVLYPQADDNGRTLNSLLHTAYTFGYEQVDPPLVEFADTLSASNAFHVLDPVSNRMMAIRSDMTPQINRIAQQRLQHKPRPIRLSYGGDVLRVRGSQTRPSRQYTQFGAELIGVDTVQADMEIIGLAIATLQSIGIDNISIDMCIPTLAYTYAGQLGVHTQDIDTVLASRNINDLAQYAPHIREVFAKLITPQTHIQDTLATVATLPACDAVTPIVQRLHHIIEALPVPQGVQMTLDPCENRGFSFHDGVAFTIFSSDSQAPLGRGGKYTLHNSDESAVGFSLYLDSLYPITHTSTDTSRIYAPYGTDTAEIATARGDGHVVVVGLDADIDTHTDAQNNKCTHIFIDNTIQRL